MCKLLYIFYRTFIELISVVPLSHEFLFKLYILEYFFRATRLQTLRNPTFFYFRSAASGRTNPAAASNARKSRQQTPSVASSSASSSRKSAAARSSNAYESVASASSSSAQAAVNGNPNHLRAARGRPSPSAEADRAASRQLQYRRSREGGANGESSTGGSDEVVNVTELD